MGRLLGGFETVLLFAVLELEGDAHGVSIRRLIEERTGRTTSPGAVHTALDRLQKRNLVESSTADSPPARGGRPRRFYRLTPAGTLALRESHTAVLKMAEGVAPRLSDLPGAQEVDA
ncbi:MAG: helix-turn-helix transcriptional regulator [Gemmatimonadetes bacterium]|nr:helix-turn-helix transcriptional regulator [Gemmatimonadota bacterium]